MASCSRDACERGAEAGPCCGFGAEVNGPPSTFRLPGDVVPPWFLKMLSSKFFTPCERHSSHKKNEARASLGFHMPRFTPEGARGMLCCAAAPPWAPIGRVRRGR